MLYFAGIEVAKAVHLIFHAETPAFMPGRKRAFLLGLWTGLNEAKASV